VFYNAPVTEHPKRCTAMIFFQNLAWCLSVNRTGGVFDSVYTEGGDNCIFTRCTGFRGESKSSSASRGIEKKNLKMTIF
jgi:hypothetical protein